MVIYLNGKCVPFMSHCDINLYLFKYFGSGGVRVNLLYSHLYINLWVYLIFVIFLS